MVLNWQSSFKYSMVMWSLVIDYTCEARPVRYLFLSDDAIQLLHTSTQVKDGSSSRIVYTVQGCLRSVMSVKYRLKVEY